MFLRKHFNTYNSYVYQNLHNLFYKRGGGIEAMYLLI